MKKGLFFLLLVASLLTGGVLIIPSSQSVVSAAPSTREIAEIDEELAILIDKRNYYKATILRLEINADRWQFDNSTYQDARRAWKEIDDTKLKMAEVDRRIAILEEEKQRLLGKDSSP